MEREERTSSHCGVKSASCFRWTPSEDILAVFWRVGMEIRCRRGAAGEAEAVTRRTLLPRQLAWVTVITVRTGLQSVNVTSDHPLRVLPTLDRWAEQLELIR